jgi:hypothetical protein
MIQNILGIDNGKSFGHASNLARIPQAMLVTLVDDAYFPSKEV